jgi:putative FmdB family regulatory protein
MPTYEYVCGKCGHEFEVVHSISAPALKICPKDKCGQKKWGRGKVTRKISGGTGLLFKGGGFYITDYRSDNYKQSAKKDSNSNAGGEAKPATAPAPASAPAPKPESKTPPAKPSAK